MKKKIIIVLCILISLIVLFLVIQNKDNENVLNQLSKTKVIVVNKLIGDGSLHEKEISNIDEVDEVIKILQNAKAMADDENIPYRGVPHYKLKMIDKNDAVIAEINVFSYSKDLSYISFDNDESYFKIDALTLLEIIDD